MLDNPSVASVAMKETDEKAGEPLATLPTRRASIEDVRLNELGYVASFQRTRSFTTILFMTLAIAAVPYGLGGPLLFGIIGGGPLSLFVGLLVVLVLDGAVALSLAELASRYPTSAGPYYWTYQLASGGSANLNSRCRAVMYSYMNGWIWLIGNWTIALSVNFGFASLIAGTIAIYIPGWTASEWQLLLIFYCICLLTFAICFLSDRFLPMVDTAAATTTLVTVIAIAIALSVTAKAGRHDAAYALGHYDGSLSGYPTGFSFFIGLLPPAYTFSAIGMITSMAEECRHSEKQVPQALMPVIPIGGVASLFFLLPICFALPPVEGILAAPYGQALPYILHTVMGTRAGAVIIMAFVFGVTLFCSISITVTASRCTFAFSLDKAVPFWSLWSSMYHRQPFAALVLVTVVEMLLGLINLGSSSAFTAFVSVGVVALALGYIIPIATSLFNGRREVSVAPWNAGPWLGPVVNVVAILWISFELVLFSMPTSLPVNKVTMNYASVVLAGFAGMGFILYYTYGRKSKFPLSPIPIDSTWHSTSYSC
ncbi:amino acid transporter [Fusarium subglutinans]|uniref:Amino acid transporter n=1 Tax=Gibberella subglutinans TaxID=42677 RepID=A0A8H5P9Y9_GIBSU|nr:amino acid transporter [Fusarium subglutinans]KAF5592657.1 amino acid transporter [Fusarium subglutinans]